MLVFARAEPSGQYLVASGVLVAEDTPPVQSIQHWTVDHTQDGELSSCRAGRRSMQGADWQLFQEPREISGTDLKGQTPTVRSSHSMSCRDGVSVGESDSTSRLRMHLLPRYGHRGLTCWSHNTLALQGTKKVSSGGSEMRTPSTWPAPVSAPLVG